MSLKRNVTALVVALATIVFAQSGYEGQDKREIKSLSEGDIVNLSAGKGMGLAKAAELNSYPGPMHVLEHADQLKLTEPQKGKIKTIFDAMHERAVSIGSKLIVAERALDKSFASGYATEPRVAAQVAEIARLAGDLRFCHLRAHLLTTPILSSEQRATYNKLRGYSSVPK